MTEKLNDSLTNKKIAVLGLSFKSGTSDVRKSPGIKIANIISEAGAIVTAYDPQANEEAKFDLRGDIMLYDTIDDTINGTEAIIIATEWPEFINLPISEYAKANNTKGSIFVDAVNRFTYEEVTNQDFVYIGVGR
jgi:UDPglucose 6-dehydrogenase